MQTNTLEQSRRKSPTTICACRLFLPPAVQADEAVSQTGHKVLVVVARPEHQIAVDRQDPQGVQQSHLLGYRLVGSTELVEHRPVQAMVYGVEGKTLGPPLGLEPDGKL